MWPSYENNLIRYNIYYFLRRALPHTRDSHSFLEFIYIKKLRWQLSLIFNAILSTVLKCSPILGDLCTQFAAAPRDTFELLGRNNNKDNTSLLARIPRESRITRPATRSSSSLISEWKFLSLMTNGNAREDVRGTQVLQLVLKYIPFSLRARLRISSTRMILRSCLVNECRFRARDFTCYKCFGLALTSG